MPSKLWEALSRAGNSVAEQIGQLYGTGRGGRPDTRAAAEDLGVSQRTVERWVAADRTPARGAGRHLAEQHQVWRDTPTGQQGATIGQQIGHLYGTTSRGQPDTRTAAEALGVSQRTVQRWIAADRAPARGAGPQLAQQHQTWRDTAPGRQGQVNPARAAQLQQHGGLVRFTGRIKISRKTGTAPPASWSPAPRWPQSSPPARTATTPSPTNCSRKPFPTPSAARCPSTPPTSRSETDPCAGSSTTTTPPSLAPTADGEAVASRFTPLPAADTSSGLAPLAPCRHRHPNPAPDGISLAARPQWRSAGPRAEAWGHPILAIFDGGARFVYRALDLMSSVP